MSKLSDECEEIYVVAGQSGVYDFINKNHPNIPWEQCDSCDCLSPAEHHICLVCGDKTKEIAEDDDDYWSQY